MKEEKIISAQSGYLHLAISLLLIAGGIFMITEGNLFALALIPILLLHIVGFTVVSPNKALVLVLFGDYKGTVIKNGFFWVNPFFTKSKISLRAANLESKPIKVNDKLGNPIMISVVLVWRVKDTYRASFDVNDFEEFVLIQSETAVRKLASAYPYDTFDDEEADVSLRSGLEDINHELEREMQDRLTMAGIEVIEARINHLAYASEIAGAMLQRQQATAIVAARLKIVEGAVGMVDMALAELSAKNIVDLDPEKRAAMVSNLMVVLCGDKNATPVVNTGTLYN
ncbi:membrane protease subunit, stomatin/prohibitin [Owenweeksia hongkongensis DSM 17368]|uniref:Membrane protease subunit, stomatin/prohibitin n=1 Tax=Owenweeksia hongkongensis (strain DSM 17368 / CIP 108786 / JCM 12287 / NRRL B-23963 / UST20020801) TaxID=926562 RepID=G8R4W7_OWEHD|nr:SPFH domain-containing protein [Owenweeksia hongkongensis]AEV34281.1 membrane protease subunit, stomatin/prohibitin [Owenweeksia hongkongensis DSM 17368]